MKKLLALLFLASPAFSAPDIKARIITDGLTVYYADTALEAGEKDESGTVKIIQNGEQVFRITSCKSCFVTSYNGKIIVASDRFIDQIKKFASKQAD